MRLIKQVLLTSLGQPHVTNENNYFSTTTPLLMATKLGRMVTYLDGLLPIKSHDPLITWSCEIPGQIKSTISLPPECLLSPKLPGL